MKCIFGEQDIIKLQSSEYRGEVTGRRCRARKVICGRIQRRPLSCVSKAVTSREGSRIVPAATSRSTQLRDTGPAAVRPSARPPDRPPVRAPIRAPDRPSARPPAALPLSRPAQFVRPSIPFYNRTRERSVCPFELIRVRARARAPRYIVPYRAGLRSPLYYFAHSRRYRSMAGALLSYRRRMDLRTYAWLQLRVSFPMNFATLFAVRCAILSTACHRIAGALRRRIAYNVAIDIKYRANAAV